MVKQQVTSHKVVLSSTNNLHDLKQLQILALNQFVKTMHKNHRAKMY